MKPQFHEDITPGLFFKGARRSASQKHLCYGNYDRRTDRPITEPPNNPAHGIRGQPYDNHVCAIAPPRLHHRLAARSYARAASISRSAAARSRDNGPSKFAGSALEAASAPVARRATSHWRVRSASSGVGANGSSPGSRRSRRAADRWAATKHTAHLNTVIASRPPPHFRG